MCYQMLYMRLWSITYNPSLLLAKDEYMYVKLVNDINFKLVNDINFKNCMFGTFENHLKLFTKINNTTDQNYI